MKRNIDNKKTGAVRHFRSTTPLLYNELKGGEKMSRELIKRALVMLELFLKMILLFI